MLRASSKTKGGPCMLYAGLDLSRKRLDFRLLDQAGETIEAGAVPPDADGLRGLAGRVARFAEPVRAAIERARWRLHLVRHRSGLKQRVHAVLLAHGQPCPVSDLFGASGRALLARLALPEPWASTVAVSLRLIDELDREIVALERELRRLGADHRYVPLLLTIPGIGWVLAYTIAAELGDIARFASPTKLAGYTGLCPRVYQSGDSDRRGPLSKQGPRYLRWALIEATTHACKHPLYRDRYQRTKTRLGNQRGPKVAQVDLARRLAEAIWHMLTRDQPFAPAGATNPLAA